MTIYEIKAYGYNAVYLNGLLYKDKDYALNEIKNKFKESNINMQYNINQIIVDTNGLLTLLSIVEREVL